MSTELPFDPFPLFPGCHQQTIIGSIFHVDPEPKSEKHVITLADKDQIAIEVTTPENWSENGLTVAMVHGLCGSHRSPYLVRMAHRLVDLGIRSVRINLRGCGSGKGLAKKLYHSGCSDDIETVVQYLHQTFPESPIILIGFSLGGNLVLKMAGELGESARGLVSEVIAIGPPVDLYKSMEMISDRTNRFYERYFLRLLRQDIDYRIKIFPDFEKVTFPRGLTMRKFDECFTAPQGGFESADDYYRKCSSARVVPDIVVPCRILFAEDDPLICSTSLDDLKLPATTRIYKTKYGGHMGYLSIPNEKNGFHWMDDLLVDWIMSR